MDYDNWKTTDPRGDAPCETCPYYTECELPCYDGDCEHGFDERCRKCDDIPSECGRDPETCTGPYEYYSFEYAHVDLDDWAMRKKGIIAREENKKKWERFDRLINKLCAENDGRHPTLPMRFIQI